jgi:hypothetical protein
MWSIVIAVAGLTLWSGAAAHDRSGCSATDYATESIKVRSEPSTKASSFQSIPRERTSSLVRIDAFSSHSGDWLKVRDGQHEGWVTARDVVCRVPSEEAQDIIAKQAAEVMQALKTANMPDLSRSVHPVKGLRFSPYASVDAKTDVVLTASQLKGTLQDPAKRVWGADDGSGAPIRLSFARYYHKFVYDRDFAQSPQVTYNKGDKGTNQTWEQYPNAIVGDYGLPETGSTQGEHLRLAFEQHEGKWYLSGIIHDGWTI